MHRFRGYFLFSGCLICWVVADNLRIPSFPFFPRPRGVLQSVCGVAVFPTGAAFAARRRCRNRLACDTYI
ncbi:hypothetical protein GCWU000324_01049 [Kingella oralis ATCC 51147]|uniref:Uncharacterized protein n=1 Tax=Kingella oralis ATCC 51147 TaxID=629741 RepID=C4GFY2_9NEIS|nr:hypothetical protein GCWU000324_01049 [Kingella oralis ATCC 51147]